MKRFICLTLLLSAGLVGGSLAAERPNIVLMMSDDQGYGDFGATGNPVIETPHIDRMARESVSMRTFYVSPVCSPTRANLMTGRYNYRTRVIDTYLGRSMMDPEEVTIAEVLHGAGYATGIFGKWHLGDCYPMRPIDQGFEQALVHRGGGLAQPSEPLENQNRYTDPILFRNGEKVRTKGYCTDVYFDAAIEFIEQARRNQRSFFVYLPTMRSTYAAATIIVFMNAWNNYLWPLIVLQTPENKTITLVISTLTAAYTPDYGVILLTTVLATLPTLVIFFVLQRQFVQGMLGAVK